MTEKESLALEKSRTLWTPQEVNTEQIRDKANAQRYDRMLVNHKTETHNRACTSVPEDDRYVHENFYPPIVSREEWERVQKILQTKIRPYRVISGSTAMPAC